MAEAGPRAFPEREDILARLDRIGQAVAATGMADALLAFGSVGANVDLVDRCSDLDFLVIARGSGKETLVADLAWLEAAAPIAFAYRHADDGYKVLSRDGIFYDFGIVRADEMARIPHGRGRIVWRSESAGSVLDSFVEPSLFGAGRPADVERLRGDFLTDLYVGLLRFERGERCSAFRLVQCEAVDALLGLGFAPSGIDSAVPSDPFAPARRAEMRRPGSAGFLASFCAGYHRTPEAALALLAAAEGLWPVDPGMAAAIRERAGGLLAIQ